MELIATLCSALAVGFLSYMEISLYLTPKHRDVLYLNMLLYALLALGMLYAGSLYRQLIFTVGSTIIMCAAGLISFKEQKFCVTYNVFAQSLVSITFIFLAMRLAEYTSRVETDYYRCAVMVGLHLIWYVVNLYLRHNTFTFIPMPEESYPSNILASIPIYLFLLFVALGGDRLLHELMTDNTIFSIFLAILVMVFETVILLLFVYSKSSLLQAQQLQDIKAQNEMNIQYLDDFSKYRKQADMQRHDLKHLVCALEQLLEQGDIESAKKMLSELANNSSVRKTGYYCDNHVINAALLDASQRCEEENIQFTPEIRIPGAVEIGDTDMAVLLMNITSNALENCKTQSGSTAAYITIDIFLKGDYLTVRCRNSASRLPKIVNGRIETTKTADGLKHGLGLESIRLICKKYDGSMKIIADDDEFTIVTLLENIAR